MTGDPGDDAGDAARREARAAVWPLLLFVEALAEGSSAMASATADMALRRAAEARAERGLDPLFDLDFSAERAAAAFEAGREAGFAEGLRAERGARVAASPDAARAEMAALFLRLQRADRLAFLAWAQEAAAA